MKAYKFIAGEFKDRIFVPTFGFYGQQRWLMSGTPTLKGSPREYHNDALLRYPRERNEVIEIDLVDYQWIHPHLPKIVKNILQNEK